MADTKRTKAALVALFADNTTGEVSPQDLRDYLESLDVSRGAYYWSAFAKTTITLQGTAVAGGTNRVKLIGTTTGKTANRFTHASPNKMTYTGPVAIRVDIFAQFCFSLDASAQDLAFEIYANGGFLTGSYTLLRYTTLNLPQQVVILGETTMTPGLPSPFLELFVANTTSAGKLLTPIAGYVNAQEMPLE